MAEPDPTSAAAQRRNNTIAWIAVGVALSPVLVDSVAHALHESFARPALIFPVVLLVRARLAEREPPRAPWLGFTIALVAALAGAGLSMADWPRFGRLAIPLCVFGLAARGGRPTLAVAGLSLWCVPLPSFVVGAVSPGLETAWLSVARLVAPAGAELGFRLEPIDGGLALAWWLAGAGYARALSLQRAGLSALPLCLGGAVAAFPIQLAAITAALFAGPASPAALVSPGEAQWWLRDVVPLAVVTLAVALAPWRPHLHLHR